MTIKQIPGLFDPRRRKCLFLLLSPHLLHSVLSLSPRGEEGGGTAGIYVAKIKRAARAMIFENAALCDEVAHLEEKFLKAKEERRFLLKSLLQYQSLSEGEMLPTPSSSSHLPAPPVSLNQAPPGASSLAPLHSVTSGTSEDAALKKPKKERKERGRENGKEECSRKISKKRKLADGSRRLVQPIPLDSSGRPVFPIVLGGLTVCSLGEVCGLGPVMIYTPQLKSFQHLMHD
uniref:Transforming growth factor beta regulator 1 n=1 Tax=Gouania willdenowi TaxID=441366 RepID=A0A8C5EK26_GOUWI